LLVFFLPVQSQLPFHLLNHTKGNSIRSYSAPAKLPATYSLSLLSILPNRAAIFYYVKWPAFKQGERTTKLYTMCASYHGKYITHKKTSANTQQKPSLPILKTSKNMRVYTDSLNIHGFKKKILTVCIFMQSNNLCK